MSEECGWPMGIHSLQMRCELAWGHKGDHVPVGSTEDPVNAAAEERGRRRGVEERDELRDRMHQTIAFLLSAVACGEKLSDEEEAGIRAMLREGLAPRDSASVTENDVAASCFGVEPRDSGKEG